MEEERSRLRRRIRAATLVLIAGLVVAGVTAIPLPTEARLIARVVDAGRGGLPAFVTSWLDTVCAAIAQVEAQAPLVFYGTDWLAFGHLVVALAFVGALRDPVRNAWLFEFGMLACAAVLPWAFVFGPIRGIPFWWRLVDCSFGVLGFVPCWLGHRWTRELARLDPYAR